MSTSLSLFVPLVIAMYMIVDKTNITFLFRYKLLHEVNVHMVNWMIFKCIDIFLQKHNVSATYKRENQSIRDKLTAPFHL